jgi:V-type H+-transporting ATPase subunit E
MVAFIIQEADEKCKEIKIRTDHDFNLLKQNMVHSGKMQVQSEYAQKDKDLDIMRRVSRSTAISDARVTKMKSRDELLTELKKGAMEKLTKQCSGPGYSKLIHDLIVQGLVKIEEPVVEIQARPEDQEIVKKALPGAVAEFIKVMSQAGHSVDPKVTISANQLPSPGTTGGVVLCALNNRVVVNQTVEARLEIAYTEIMATIRAGLFPSQV